MNNWRLKLRLLGVRGSIPTPERQNLGYGGNTSCVEIRTPDGGLYVIDAGSGIRTLGPELMRASDKQPVHLFFSHFHWDHIQGLPFFGPIYDPSRPITLYSTCYSAPLRETLAGQMMAPYFPVKFDFISSRLKFVDIGSEPIRFGALTLTPFEMNHPQGAGGYRIEHQGAVIVYATDREHGHSRLDSVLRDHAQNADVLIHDSQYTPEEYEDHKGWGHSTWVEALSVTRDANVKQVILFHHDPSHDDGTVTEIVENASAKFDNVVGACEGWTISI
jgi:phosphoribosyl 1,2-cyclic phosphodiesterase